MIIIPAIDILGEKCVRLSRGEYETALEVSGDPVETAKYFAACGAEYIHMVDLDGAKNGSPQNSEIFIKTAANVDVPVELGGGIRDQKTVEYYINNGISRVILGSAALQNKKFTKEAVQKYGEKIAVGIDAKNRKAQTSGWLAGSDTDFVELAAEMAQIGVQNIIYTDISKDGMLSGVNIRHYEELKDALPPNVKITASGGVSGMEDIAALCALDIYGVICGKAIYSGSLDLARAVKFTKRNTDG
ncbi:MAG: 1-(5-phosphoribosyl)-5-[(5-phosphoribosylamino)methylideneamino]imidazole-4-carboxamide isomerase [Oscillospiraceae bacterium]|nr:1-(5-phosphoribosyl)-5-[(5-phosphoribosylamino)methylideneamino]imidazole-4-carboxamide isomerase [Oscillospiraceae bacterium]